MPFLAHILIGIFLVRHINRNATPMDNRLIIIPGEGAGVFSGTIVNLTGLGEGCGEGVGDTWVQ